jgi:hypothetical protein
MMLQPVILIRFFVMAGQKREARLRADVPAIHVFLALAPLRRGCPAQDRA